MKKVTLLAIISTIVFMVACGSGGGSASSAKAIKSGPVGNLTATMSNADGVLKKGKQTFTLSFADSSGKPVDVGAASLNFFMPAMGSMAAMNSAATLTTTSTPGVYTANADIEMAGDWQAQIKFDGPAGKGSGTLAITAQQ